MSYKYKVLVADDSEACLIMIREIFFLPGKNIELIFAHNGKEALELSIAHEPDLMLFDVIMPEINGIELVKMIRQNIKLKDTPIIILSATESLKSAFEAGADDFITKPFNQYELLIKARSALNLIENIREIKKSKEELEAQNAEIENQRNKILEQKKEIIDDITYSKRIQQAIMPTSDQISKIIPDSFIYNRPRNIVSGDFFWLDEHLGRKVIVVADCTGHGISGAFMTMAGTVFLNDVFATSFPLSSNEVLNRLRAQVMSLLKQKGETGEASDGMDVSIVIYNEENSTIQFSGANNPLYLIRNNELEIYKGDRMPIGIHLNFEKSFTRNDIKIEPGDRFYMFSDGYADQFGGPANKKFRYKQFRELLTENNQKPFEKQKEIFENALLDWMGINEQVDDILLMGFQLK